MRWWLVVVCLIVGTGCGSRCKEVEDARSALRAHVGATGRAADVRVTVPFARANEVFAASLAQQPLTMPLEAPELPVPVPIEVPAFEATVRDVKVVPAAVGKVRFATAIEVRDAEAEVATMRMVVEVTPVLERVEGGAQLSIGFGPENLVAIEPELGAEARQALGAVVERWLPAKAKGKVPRPLLELAAGKLAEHLTKATYGVLQRTLLPRLGEVTRLRLRLPQVPIERVEIHSTEAALLVEILTNLPVRAGLGASGEAREAREVQVELAASAVAELANWAIDEGHAPRWYDRGLTPRADGEYRPRFDYVAEDRAHPFKVYVFQERGGCSYFRVGAQASLAMKGERLEATVLDRELERTAAHPVIEVAAAVKYFLVGSLDRSKQVAAHTRLAAGRRAFETRVTGAALERDAVRFTLRFEAAPTLSSSRGTR